MSGSLPHEFLQRLISIGASQEFVKLYVLFSQFPDQTDGDFMRCGADFWQPIADPLSDTELESLIRSLAIIERDFEPLRGGSASAAIWTFELLMKRRNCGDLAKWILENASSYHIDKYMKNYSK